MEHYQRTRIVAERIHKWITDENRGEWSAFSREMTLKFGVRKRFLEKILSENYPTITIENDRLAINEADGS